jgi:hypothetical protein
VVWHAPQQLRSCMGAHTCQDTAAGPPAAMSWSPHWGCNRPTKPPGCCCCVLPRCQVGTNLQPDSQTNRQAHNGPSCYRHTGHVHCSIRKQTQHCGYHHVLHCNCTHCCSTPAGDLSPPYPWQGCLQYINGMLSQPSRSLSPNSSCATWCIASSDVRADVAGRALLELTWLTTAAGLALHGCPRPCKERCS